LSWKSANANTCAAPRCGYGGVALQWLPFGPAPHAQ
jgi:hypothetical protein